MGLISLCLRYRSGRLTWFIFSHFLFKELQQNGRAHKSKPRHPKLGAEGIAPNLVFWGPRSFQFDLEMKINIFVCTILIEKITGGPSGPLAIIYFFQKKRTHKHTYKQVRPFTI